MIPLWIIWIIAGIILMIVEIFTPAFYSMMIGVSFVITGIIAVIFPDSIVTQLITLSISLVLTLILIRPVVLRFLTKKNTKESNINGIIGKEVIVTENINNLKNTGYIKINADYFKAKSADGNNIPKDSIVIIEKFEGITATVTLKK